MKKWIFALAVSTFAVLNAGDTQSDESNGDSQSQESPDNSTSTFDKVIEAIAEAATRDRDFGKDIGDR